jgi:ATP-dependent DNA helicase PIF1
MIYLRHHPNTQILVNAELGLREQDNNFDWFAFFEQYSEEQINQSINFIQNQKGQFNLSMDNYYQIPEVEFSPTQQRILDVVQAQINFLTTGEQQNDFRRFLVVQGKAGSGKSTVIKAIKSIVYNQFGENSCMVVAPTGSAASLIEAKTIHNSFKINIDNKLSSLNPQALNDLQENFYNCKFIIIDEMSLVGCTLFRKIDLRCRIAKSINEPFGGMFVILLGDLKQLPPVRDRPFYGTSYNNQYVNEGQALFRNFHASIILPTSFRQAPEEQEFRDILDRLADGATTLEDWRILNSRAFLNLNTNEKQQFHDSVHLFDTCAEANNYNYSRLSEFEAVYRVSAINNNRNAENASSRDAENLVNVLYLAIGCRVVLKKNLWTDTGLVNGALRTVTEIVVQRDNDEMPLFVNVRFDNYRGPTLNGE